KSYIASCASGRVEDAVAAEQFAHSLGGNRAREDIALDLVASERTHDAELLGRGDAGRDGLHAEAAGQGNHGADDGGALRILGGDRLDEALVDLQRIEFGAAQIAERGIAGAEI